MPDDHQAQRTVSSPVHSAQPPAGTPTRRRVFTGLAAAPLLGVLASCSSLLPGEGNHPEATVEPSPSDPGVPSDGGGSPSDGGGAAQPEPFAGWADPAEVGTASVDLAAVDDRFGTMRGQLERSDRYGTWSSPGLPEDSPVFTHEPASISPEAEAVADRQTLIALARSVLVQNIVQILDSSLLFEADNARSTEISPALVEAFSLEGIDPQAFDGLFEQIQISGSPVPDRGVPEVYELEPAPYAPDQPRLHLLEIGSTVDRIQDPAMEGVRVTASASAAFPVIIDGAEMLWHRSTTLTVGLSDQDGSVLMAFGVGASGVAHWVESPESLPLLEAPAAPEGWTEHTVDALTASMPAQLEARATIERGLMLGERPDPAGTINHHLLPAPAPLPLGNGQHVARGEVPGASFAVVEVDEIEDGRAIITLIAQTQSDQYRVQLTGFPYEEAEELAHGLLATAHLAS